MIAFVTDEEGVSVLHVLNTSTKKEMPVPKLPAGVGRALRWHKNGHDLGFSLNNARGPGDGDSLGVATGKGERWTTSETAGGAGGVPRGEAGGGERFDG